jgi:hypothetical protein
MSGCRCCPYPAFSLPIPCQAPRQGKTFPAIVRGITRKVLILQESVQEIEKFSLLFPVGRSASSFEWSEYDDFHEKQPSYSAVLLESQPRPGSAFRMQPPLWGV